MTYMQVIQEFLEKYKIMYAYHILLTVIINKTTHMFTEDRTKRW